MSLRKPAAWFGKKSISFGGEFPGTIAPLEIQAQVAGELENTIARMVAKITEEESGFPLERWKSEWSEALKK